MYSLTDMTVMMVASMLLIALEAIYSLVHLFTKLQQYTLAVFVSVTMAVAGESVRRYMHFVWCVAQRSGCCLSL